MGASLSDFDRWQATQPRADTTQAPVSDFDQWQASQRDTTDAPAYQYEPQDRGVRSQVFDSKAEPWASVKPDSVPPTPKHPAPAATAGRWDKIKAAAGGLLDQLTPQNGMEAVYPASVAGRIVSGLGSQLVSQAYEAPVAPGIGDQRRGNLRAPTPSLGPQSGTYDAEHGAITDTERRNAGIATVANIGAGAIPVGAIASPLLRAGARVAVDAGVGSANMPSDPLTGGVIGASLGFAHSAPSLASEAIERVPSLPNIQRSIAARIDPETAGQARQVPQLAAERDIANARAAAQQRNAEALAARVLPDAAPGATQGPAPSRAFAEFDNLTPEQQQALGPRASYQSSDYDRWHAEQQVASGRAPAQIPPDAPAAAAGSHPARAQEPPAPSNGPAPRPLLPRGVDDAATPAAPDPDLQPSLHDQRRAPGGADHEGRMPWDDGYGTDQPAVDAAPVTPRQLATRDGQGRLVRNLKHVPLDDLHKEYSNLADATATNRSVAPWARNTEYGTTVTGTSRANWSVNSQFKAMDRIKAEIERRGAEVEYRNAGVPSLPAKTGDFIRGAIDRPYPELEHQPQDLPVRDALLGAGAGRTHGLNVARYGMAHVRAGLSDASVQAIESHIFADNFEMQAASREAAGDPTAAANLRAHAALARSLSSPGIENTPDYQQYVGRYRDVMEPEYNRVATASGLSADKFRAVKPGSVYIPLPADIEQAAPTNTIRPPVRRLGTKQSSAVRVATGGASSYVIDAQHAAEQFLPERSRVAGENELWQAVRSRGRDMTGQHEPLQDGEVQIAFTDQNQLTTPESADATKFVALPQHVADGVQQYVNRARELSTPPAGLVGKGWAAAKKLLTKGAVAINPAVTLTHGGNIASTVNLLPGSGAVEVGRALASAVPFGNTLSGLTEMATADLTSSAHTKALLGASRYGGLRPLEADPEALGLRNAQHKLLFGQTGADPRGRAIAIQRYRAYNPGASDADVAQFLNKTFGAYVPANQPAAVYAGQRTGLTTFAPAGFAFTSSAVKRLAGQSGMGGVGNAAKTFGKTVVAPVAGLAAANYALSGHSSLDNEEGHRGDLDLGSQDEQGRERYLKSSYAYPLLNRAANTTGLRPLLEGQGATGAYVGAANEVGSQIGVVPRMAASLANQQLRLNSQDAMPEAVTKPQFGDGNRFMKILQRSAGGAMGAPAGIAGSTNFSADRPLGERTLDALHLNPVAKGRAGGTPDGSALYNALDEKMQSAKADVYRAETDADKAAVIAQTLAKARADGYSGDQLELIEKSLSAAAEKSRGDRADARATAMERTGFAPSDPGASRTP